MEIIRRELSLTHRERRRALAVFCEAAPISSMSGMFARLTATITFPTADYSTLVCVCSSVPGSSKLGGTIRIRGLADA